MKLFGNTHRKGSSDHGDTGSIPTPMDKTPRKDDEDWDEEIIDDESDAAEEPDEEDTLETYLDDEDYEDFEDGDDTDYDDYDDYGDSEDEMPPKKRMSTVKKVLIVGLSLLVVVLIGCGLFVNYLLGLINYQKANSDYFVTVSTAEDLPEEKAINDELAAIDEKELASMLEATPEEIAAWDSKLQDITSDRSTYEVPISEDVYNILLVGSDARDLSEAARSDAMILVSLNQKTKTIYLTSFLRDCYVSIPGYGNTKLNHAFAYGGPALLMETLEDNFKVHVDRYAAVNFYSFMDVVDILNGVWIYVTDEELKVTNDYIYSMNKLLDVEWSEDYLWSSGWHQMNGKQALAYSRNRYTGDDYARTERQRNVIYQIINGAMSAEPAVLVDLALAILPQITTDMEKSEILSYAANVGAYLDYEIVSQQIPAKGTYSGATISGMSVISLDLEDNIEYLQSTVYGDVSYSDNSTETEGDEADGEDETDKSSSAEEPADSPKPSPSAKASVSAKPKTSTAPKASASPNIAPPNTDEDDDS